MKRFLSILMSLLILLAPLSVSAEAASFNVNGVAIPLSDWPAPGPSYGPGACAKFAQMVYQRIWGQYYTPYRGSSDDMLRNVPAGIERAITAPNAERFLSAAQPGAVIRVTDDISENDVRGTKMHSMILAQKDANGVTIYHSGSSGVSLHRFTWTGFANFFQDYGYFKYIKWPNAPAFSIVTVPANVSLSANKTTCPLGESVTFTAGSDNASYYTLNVRDSSGTSVFSSGSFSSSVVWTPSGSGTFNAQVTAVNSAGSASSQSVSVNVYDSAPSEPTIVINNQTPIVGETISISWSGSENVEEYTCLIRNTTLFSSYETKRISSKESDSYKSTFPEGDYLVQVTAKNPFGSSVSYASFKVEGCTASGRCGDNATWMLNTETKMLTIEGTGAMYDYTSPTGNNPPPWINYSSSIESLYMKNGLTVIGQRAFYQMENLKYIHFPTTLTKISDFAFLLCTSLVGSLYEYKGKYETSTTGGIVLPKSLKELGTGAFATCKSLNSVLFGTDQCDLVLGQHSFINCPSSLTLCSPSMILGDTDPERSKYSWAIKVYMYQVNFDVNGGEALNGSDSYLNDFGETYWLTSEKPVRRGFTFLGWYTQPNGGTRVTDNTICEEPGPHTLYAHWEANEHTVSLSTVGGGVMALPAGSENPSLFAENDTVITVAYWKKYGTMPTPEMPGCKFTGWSTAPDGGEVITEDTIFTLDDDQTLYATWEPLDSEYTSNPASIEIQAMDQDSMIYVGEIPSGKSSFKITLKNLPSTVESAHVLLASYTAEDKFVKLVHSETVDAAGKSEISLQTPLQSPGENVAKVKVFVVDALETLMPLVPSAEFPGEYTAPLSDIGGGT